MDKSRASVELCLNSVREKLKVKPLMTQLPVFEDSLFIGLVDLLTMKKLTWSPRHDNSGKTFSIKPLKESDDDDWWLEAAHHRRKLVENVVDLDDAIAESVLETEDLDSVSPSDLEMALRRITISQTGVPVFCGSSYKNVGVQPLMDAVIKYLPMPSERKHEFVSYYGDDLCALVFKIVHDKYKGRITFIRIYSGSLERGQRLYNLNRKTSERITSLLIAYADDFEEVSKLGSGHIAAVTGLHCVITGDTLVSSQGSAKDASKRFKKESGKDDAVVLAGVTIPPPVFFCSIEPASARYQKPLEQALELLQVEDPSLKVKTDHDTGQTVISGEFFFSNDTRCFFNQM